MTPKLHLISGGCMLLDHSLFNCICHMGVAAIAGSVHLMISMDGKLGRKGSRGQAKP
jgi:hypothetical protein